MRVHGLHANISARFPRARAVCDRCGQIWNHDRLLWQYQWQGPRLQNIRLLVCQPCYDIPQEQLRTIVLPPDPIPIQNARPENYVSDNNPLSGIGMNATPLLATYGAAIGNLTGGGGTQAAFDSNTNKPAWMSASNTISNSSYNNWIGINWAGYLPTVTPSSIGGPILSHTVTSFTAYAPNDRSFLGNTATSYVVQGTPTLSNVYGAWTTLYSGTTAGTNGESITASVPSGGPYQFHRIAFLGDQLNYVSVAQLQLSVGETSSQ